MTKYDETAAGSRHRSLQYFPALRRSGFEPSWSPLFDGRYLRSRYLKGRGGVSDFARAARRRLQALVELRRYRLLFLEEELFPYLPISAERLIGAQGVPYVVDYDDATFHQYDRHANWFVRSLLKDKIKNVMRGARLVLAGNRYLADHAVEAGASHVEVVPTALDPARYACAVPPRSIFTIGWIGSPSTTHYLDVLRGPLEAIGMGRRARLLLIGASTQAPIAIQTEMVSWSESTEAQHLSRCDVGVMPLIDGPWERGKCGFKLLQYMAAGLPVVASPVGVNCEIVEHGVTGFLASTPQEWCEALGRLRADSLLRRRMGEAGRSVVRRRYSIDATFPTIERSLRAAVASRQ
jgi:glycosyltransferase involved in cell wall biosynthesis